MQRCHRPSLRSLLLGLWLRSVSSENARSPWRCWWGRQTRGCGLSLQRPSFLGGAGPRGLLDPLALTFTLSPGPRLSVLLIFRNQLRALLFSLALLWVTPLIPAPACTWLFLACLLLTSLLLGFPNRELGCWVLISLLLQHVPLAASAHLGRSQSSRCPGAPLRRGPWPLRSSQMSSSA